VVKKTDYMDMDKEKEGEAGRKEVLKEKQPREFKASHTLKCPLDGERGKKIRGNS